MNTKIYSILCLDCSLFLPSFVHEMVPDQAFALPGLKENQVRILNSPAAV